jgi:hypothetical protein
MCGRYTRFAATELIYKRFGIRTPTPEAPRAPHLPPFWLNLTLVGACPFHGARRCLSGCLVRFLNATPIQDSFEIRTHEVVFKVSASRADAFDRSGVQCANPPASASLCCS